MFFVIAGVSPKTKILDQNPRRCPTCGQNAMVRVRVDHYLNLFFIPLFPVKRGEPVLQCRNCHRTASEGLSDPRGHCPSCGAAVQPDHRFCPYCGRPV